MTREYGINLRKIQGQYTTLCLYPGGVWGICLWKIHAVKLISGAPLRAMDTSVFSHLSLKAAFEGLLALYPNLQREAEIQDLAWGNATTCVSPYSPFLQLLQTQQMMVPVLLRLLNSCWFLFGPPWEASIIYSTIRPPTDPRKNFRTCPSH